jgi:hypothetical protein
MDKPNINVTMRAVASSEPFLILISAVYEGDKQKMLV